MTDGPRARAARFGLIAALLTLAGIAGLGLAVLGQTDGVISYTLDDPYIHLSLAENILRGHYGINAGEYASPSSSIIYPVLLSGLLALGLGDWSPLILNGLPMLAAAWLIGGLLGRVSVSTAWMPFVALPLVLLAINALALPFTGMEHSLHVLASLMIVTGLIRLVEDGVVPRGLILAIIVAPLIRFEGLALALGAIGALLVWRKTGAAVLALAVVLACLGGYVALMTTLGLPPLPSSVMVKSQASAGAVEADALRVTVSVVVQVILSLKTQPAAIVLIGGLGAALLSLIVVGRQRPGQGTLAGVLIFAGVAHLFLGDYGWFSRYEIYMLATLYAALLWLYAPLLAKGTALTATFICLIAAGLAALYVRPVVLTPAAAKNIRDQQWQMHRFATEFFPETVAVNDLGWVSYRNPGYVLDLWGLGSEEARLIRAGGQTAADINALAQRHDVAFAMIYDSWFDGSIPDQWCRIAVLHTIQVTAADDQVAFYLVDRAAEARMRAALDQMRADLLPDTTLDIFACPAG